MRVLWDANAYTTAAVLFWLCYMLPGQNATNSERHCVQSGPFKAAQTGVLKLGLGSTNRDGYLYVPPQYDPSKASSFILAIHAAGKSGIDALQLLYSSAASSGKACPAKRPWKAGNWCSVSARHASPATVHRLTLSCGAVPSMSTPACIVNAPCKWLRQHALMHPSDMLCAQDFVL